MLAGGAQPAPVIPRYFCKYYGPVAGAAVDIAIPAAAADWVAEKLYTLLIVFSEEVANIMAKFIILAGLKPVRLLGYGIWRFIH